MTALSLPDSLAHIKEYAFYCCTGLQGSLTIPDSVSFVGPNAFCNCGISEVSFGSAVRSVGEGAFLGCAALASAGFTGPLTADYYGPEEKKPSFPESCRVSAAPGGASWRDAWTKTENGSAAGGADGGEAKDMPYFWTQELPERDFAGAGTYADVILRFEGDKLRVSVNGRPFDEQEFTADPNDYDNRIVHTEGTRCLNASFRDLRFRKGYNRDAQLIAELVFDDGTTEEVIFHTGSEESLFLDDGSAA